MSKTLYAIAVEAVAITDDEQLADMLVRHENGHRARAGQAPLQVVAMACRGAGQIHGRSTEAYYPARPAGTMPGGRAYSILPPAGEDRSGSITPEMAEQVFRGMGPAPAIDTPVGRILVVMASKLPCPDRGDGGPHEFSPDYEYSEADAPVTCEICGETPTVVWMGVDRDERAKVWNLATDAAINDALKKGDE